MTNYIEFIINTHKIQTRKNKSRKHHQPSCLSGHLMQSSLHTDHYTITVLTFYLKIFFFLTPFKVFLQMLQVLYQGNIKF